MNHHDFHNFKAKINDKSSSLTRIFGIFILIIEYLKGNRLPIELNKEQLLKNHKLFETELKRKGACVVKNFISEEKAFMLGKDLLAILKEHYSNNSLTNNLYEEEKFLIQKGSKKLKTYDELQKYKKTVFHIRDTEEDKGFIDIFNVNLLLKDDFFKELLGNFESININQSLEEVIGKKVKISSLNAYITPHLEKTRCLHNDSLLKDAKVFVYLNDVSTSEKGPYGYVLGSHNYNFFYYLWMKIYLYLPKFLKANLRATDSVFFKTKDAHFFTGKAGTLICSLQNGVHRGFPQTSQDTRIMLVARYN